MINKTRIISALVALSALLSMASCGGEKEPSPENYERPVVTMARAITAMDSDAYFNCYTEEAKNEYFESDDYNSDLVMTFLPSQSENKRILKTRTTSDKELNQKKIDELKEQYKDKYKKRLDITKARKLTVDFILQGEKELVETKAFTVVWVENRWLVFGDVLEEFEFEKK